MKDGSNRICVDYKKLNNLIISDSEPMKTIENLFQQLKKSTFLLKTNLSKGHLADTGGGKNVSKTTFVTPDGAYKFFLMLFGMKNSGATVVHGMMEVFVRLV